MIRQLTFDLPAQENLTRADFTISGANALALAALDQWQDWPGRKMLLVGPQGAGKTHLAAIWAADTAALPLTGADLVATDLARLDEGRAVVVEDADRVAGDPAAEEALFHLHNIATRAGHLLLTARTPPRDWGLRLPDLLSRMQAAPLTRLDPPDDALLAKLLAKLFADRQLAVQPALLPWLVARMPRSFAAARAIVAELDARSLAQARPITLRLAAEILDMDAPEW
ncbi:chromosomal replication initiator DnaA [Neotabrizicola sp. sgz301269]|uniref:chromosomal replication initiator DnaA n=1 Tax=Neotabrizicola sp. sgz301269 TaxID=3276282 RepID=UPI0037706F72